MLNKNSKTSVLKLPIVSRTQPGGTIAVTISWNLFCTNFKFNSCIVIFVSFYAELCLKKRNATVIKWEFHCFFITRNQGFLSFMEQSVLGVLQVLITSFSTGKNLPSETKSKELGTATFSRC